MEDMIAICQERFKEDEFYLVDVLSDKLMEADFYICSGAMNILAKKQFYTFIERCFRASKRGFVFNFLKNKSFNNIKIEEVISFCSNLTDTIATKNDYLDNDFTIFMIK